jgi:hypothetical protein
MPGVGRQLADRLPPARRPDVQPVAVDGSPPLEANGPSVSSLCGRTMLSRHEILMGRCRCREGVIGTAAFRASAESDYDDGTAHPDRRRNGDAVTVGEATQSFA